LTSPAVPRATTLKKQIEAGKYKGIVKTTLDGFDQRDYLEGNSDNSARDHTSSTSRDRRHPRCATRTGRCITPCRSPGAAGWVMPLVPFHFTLVQNIKRDPFEQNVGLDVKSATAMGGSLGSPSPPPSCTTGTCCPSASNCGSREHLLSYEKFPPLQPPETYNGDQRSGQGPIQHQ
jgi:hypothetical protein